MGHALSWWCRHQPDELLYSIGARLAAINVIHGHAAINRSVFGSDRVAPASDLPCSLNETFQQIGQRAGFTSVDDLLERSTLYPYHRYFLPQQKWQRVRELAFGPHGGAVKVFLGLVANGFGARLPMRSCIQCDRESWSSSSAIYWHRSHQLPGVEVCSVHCAPLVIHTVQGTPSRRGLIAPPALGRAAPVSIRSLPSAVRLAKLSEDLLHTHDVGPPWELRRRAFHRALDARGFARGRQQLRWEDIEASLLDHFGGFEGHPFDQRLLRRSKASLLWLYATLGGRQKTTHPLCQLLLIDWLFGSLHAFEQACARESELHSPEPSSDEAYPGLSDLALSCRSAARACGQSTSTVVKERHRLGLPVATRPKVLRGAKREVVAELIASGLPIAEIASDQALSASAVYKLLESNDFLSLARRHAQTAALSEERRSAWLRAIGKKRDRPILKARRTHPALYSWLYRHERDWLLAVNEKFSQQRMN